MAVHPDCPASPSGQKRNQGAGTLRLRKPRTLWHSETPKDRQLRTEAQHYPLMLGSIGRRGHSMRSVGMYGWRCRSTAQAPALSQEVVSHPRSSLAPPDRLRMNSGWRGISPTPPTGAWNRASCTGNMVGPVHGDTGSHLSIQVSTGVRATHPRP